MMKRTSSSLGAYTTEKGGKIISYTHPLLFVQGPPVFVKVKVVEEESTSVFSPDETFLKEKIDIASTDIPLALAEDDSQKPEIRGLIDYLNRPFQKQAYQPLQFIVEGKTVKGDIQKVQDSTIWIGNDGDVTEVEISLIEDVLWRGQSFDRT